MYEWSEWMDGLVDEWRDEHVKNWQEMIMKHFPVLLYMKHVLSQCFCEVASVCALTLWQYLLLSDSYVSPT